MWKNNFRVRKLQTVMIFAVILLCSMLMNSSISILTSLDKPFNQFAKQCKAATIVLTPYLTEKSEVEDMGQKMAKLEHVTHVEYETHKDITDEVMYKGEKVDCIMYMTTYEKEIYSNISYIEGSIKDMETLKENEIVIPACVSEEYGIHKNEQITIHYATGEKTYTVKAVYSDPYNTSNAFSARYFVSNYPEKNTLNYSIFVYGDGTVSGAELLDEYREQNAGLLPAYANTIEDMETNTMLPGNLVGGIFLGISIILLLVSILIINFIIRNIMISDVRTVAIYKTLGYSYPDILKIYLKFYFTIVATACLTGIGCSYFLSSVVLDNIYRVLGPVQKNYSIVLAIPCLVLVIGLVIGVIYHILHKTKSVKPVAILAGYGNNNGKKHQDSSGHRISFSPFGIALREILTNKKGMIGILVTSIATIFIINFATVSLDVAYSVGDNNDYWFGIDDPQIVVNVADYENYEDVHEVLQADSRVERVVRSNLDNGKVSLKWEKGKEITYMEPFIYESYKNLNFSMLEGRNPEHADEIAISSLVAEKWDKTVGDYMDVYLPKTGKVSLLITGIYQTYFALGKNCRMLYSTYEENGAPITYTYMSVYLKDSAQTDSFITDMKMKLHNQAGVMRRNELFSNIMNIIITPQRTAIPPVMVIIFLIGGVNIFSIVLLKNASNERNNGIYKCLGYTTGHIIKSNLCYVLIVALGAMVVAVPAILFCYPKIMSVCLSVFQLKEYSTEYDVIHLIMSNVAILLAFVVSTVLSSLSIRRIKVQKLVQE